MWIDKQIKSGSALVFYFKLVGEMVGLTTVVETQYSRFTLVSISSASYSQLEILIVILPGLDHTGEIEFGLSLIATKTKSPTLYGIIRLS